ncbi:MAG: hypothetical protein SFV21_03785 [Rhodospirillaceae bacterium]|nr:hypothetical protein [Rhodospirillaceae bacterium]
MADAPKPAPEAAKPAPAPIKKPTPPDDDEPKAKKLIAKPAPTSGRSLGRAIIVASIFVTIGWVVSARFAERFELVPVQTPDNTYIYRLDTVSGAVHFCTSAQCVELPVK